MASLVHVVGGVIYKDHQILLFRRKDGLQLFEFPGGKVEPMESQSQALRREFQEELEVDAIVGESIGSVDFQSKGRAIRLTAYWVVPKSWDFKMNDHSEMLWLAEKDIQDPKILQEIMPADQPLLASAFAKMTAKK